MKGLIFALSLFVLAACESQKGAHNAAHQPYERQVTPEEFRSFLETASDSQIRSRAVAQARKDGRAGVPHVAWCGGSSLHRPNIPARKEKLVIGLPPVDGLPVGLTDPLMRQGMRYASAYNGEIVKHLPVSESKPGLFSNLFHSRKVNTPR